MTEASDRVIGCFRDWMKGPVQPDNCPVRDVLDRLGEKWAILLISALAERERRFNEFQRVIPDISKRSLAQALRNLAQDGIISRTVHATKPPSVTYALTPLGHTMLEPLSTLIAWAATSHRAIKKARLVSRGSEALNA